MLSFPLYMGNGPMQLNGDLFHRLFPRQIAKVIVVTLPLRLVQQSIGERHLLWRINCSFSNAFVCLILILFMLSLVEGAAFSFCVLSFPLSFWVSLISTNNSHCVMCCTYLVMPASHLPLLFVMLVYTLCLLAELFFIWYRKRIDRKSRSEPAYLSCSVANR